MYDDSAFNILPVRKGRSTALNPLGRFPRQEALFEADTLEADELRQIETQFFEEKTRKVLSINDSPDLGFKYSVNAYRGCEHGCVYCYARPSHEYWGLSAGLDFETQIIVKKDPHLVLAKELASSRWTPQAVLLSGNTDPYQPAERVFGNTRRLLEVFLEFKHPVIIITKSHRILKDLDLLKRLAKDRLVHVILSVTSLDSELSLKIEPRAPIPASRLDAIKKLSENGISVGINIAPVIPGLTDDEIPSILKAGKEFGASYANYIVLRLPGSVKEIFVEWLEREFPNHRRKVINRLKSLRGGRLYDARFGRRMKGEGIWANLIRELFELGIEESRLNEGKPILNTSLYQNPSLRIDNQIDLFI